MILSKNLICACLKPKTSLGSICVNLTSLCYFRHLFLATVRNLTKSFSFGSNLTKSFSLHHSVQQFYFFLTKQPSSEDKAPIFALAMSQRAASSLIMMNTVDAGDNLC